MHAERMKQRREQVDMSQERLGQLIGTRREKIAAWESGREDIPATDLALVARALSVPSDWLLGLSEDIRARDAKKLDSLEILAIKILRSKPKERRKLLVQVMKVF